MSVPNLKRIALFAQKLLGSHKISKLGHVTQATPAQGSFYGPHAGSVLYVCTKFEADSSIRSKVIMGYQNLVRDPSHADLGVVS